MVAKSFKRYITSITIGLVITHTPLTKSNAQSACFSSLFDYSFAGPSQGRVVINADFDNDGFNDLIIGQSQLSNPTNLRFLKGTGDGKFGAPAAFDAGFRPYALVAHDFDLDGNLDLAVTNNTTNSVSVVMGNGNGTFGAPTVYQSPGAPSFNYAPFGMDKADFNNDGRMDLVVVASFFNGYYIMFGGVTPGTFTQSALFTTAGGGSNARTVVAADLNNDSNMDVAVVHQGMDNIGVRFGNGSGGFAAATTYALAGSDAPLYITKGHFNGDGFMDLAVSNTLTQNMTVLLNNGAGAFPASTAYAARLLPGTIQTGDFNEDSNTDIVLVNESDNSISYYQNTGAGTFNPQVSFPGVGVPKGMTVGDFDNDSNLDVVYGSELGTTQPTPIGLVSIMRGTGTGSFVSIALDATGTLPNGIVAADFNEDGDMDYVTSNNGASNISLFTGLGNGLFNAGVNFATADPPLAICKGDFNGDNNVDVITANEAGGTDEINVFLGTGTGSFGAPTSFNTVSGPVKIISFDIDVDGDMDVLVVGQGSGGTIGTMLNNGSGSFAAPTTVATGTTPTSVTAGKINSDAIPDIAYSNSGSNNVSVRMGSGGGAFLTATNIPVGNGPADIMAADLNGDTYVELVTANFSANNVSVITNQGTGTGAYFAAVNTLANTNPQSVVINDFNQDGALDIATSNFLAGNTAGVVDVFMNSGTGTFAMYKTFSARLNPKQLTSADFNGDNMPDIVIANNVSAQGSILLNTTPYITPLGPTLFCGGGSVDLQSSPATTYLWSNSDVTQISTISTSGSYTVTTGSSFSNWCVSTSAPEVVTAAALPSIASVTGSTTICPGTSTALTATSGVGAPTYQWYNAPTGGTLLFTGPTFTTPSLISNTTYYVTVTDAGTGCTSNPRHAVTVTVSDAIAPVISGMPSNIVLNAGASCNAVATWTAPSATDNCVLISFTSNFSSGATFPIGPPTTVTYTATDAASNQSQASFTVTVNDVTNPVITGTPSNITVNNTVGQCGANVSWTAPTASDNCSVASLICSHTIGQFFAVGGPYTVTYTATDGSGNVLVTSFTVTVNDTQLPTISGMPANVNTTVGVGTCCKAVTWTAPTAADNCAISSLTSSHTSGTCFPVGLTTVTYTATDNNGNVTTSNFTITVVDNINPSIVGMPANINQNAVNGGCFRVVTWTMPTASDNCPGSSIVITSGLPSGSSYPVGVNQVCFTATDAAGNIATGCFNITITDNQLPYYTTFPANINANCSPGQCSAVVTWPATVEADNCGIQSETSNFSSGATFPVGVTAVNYQLIDVNGNVHNQSFNVTVTDNIAPTAVGCPTTITACTGQAVNYTAPTGTDNCPGVTVTQTAGNPSGFIYSGSGTFLHTFRVEDAAGNFVLCNFNVIVNASPTVTLNIGDVLHCINHPVYALNGGSPAGGTYSGPGVVGSNFNPATAGVGTHTITYTFTATNGCSAQTTQQITVEPLSCTGILDAPENPQLKVYPNPNDGNFTIEIPAGYENATLFVINGVGEIVYTNTHLNGNIQVALPHVQRGMYLLRLSAADKTPYTARVVID